MIEAIIFDFGNVICSFTNEILVDRISKLSGKTKDEVFDLIYKESDLPKKYETGLITSQEFYSGLSKLLGLNVPYEQFKEIYYKDKFTPVEGTMDLIKKLQKNYRINLLSNTSEWDFEYMVKAAPIIKTFEKITTSFESKSMKPDKKIFLDALDKLKLKPEECIYTDDILEYAKAATSLGMKGIQFTTAKKFEEDLKKLKVEI